MNKKSLILLIILIVAVLFLVSIFTLDFIERQKEAADLIKISLIDADTNAPIANKNVLIKDSEHLYSLPPVVTEYIEDFSATTDDSGSFYIGRKYLKRYRASFQVDEYWSLYINSVSDPGNITKIIIGPDIDNGYTKYLRDVEFDLADMNQKELFLQLKKFD